MRPFFAEPCVSLALKEDPGLSIESHSLDALALTRWLDNELSKERARLRDHHEELLADLMLQLRQTTCSEESINLDCNEIEEPLTCVDDLAEKTRAQSICSKKSEDDIVPNGKQGRRATVFASLNDLSKLKPRDFSRLATGGVSLQHLALSNIVLHPMFDLLAAIMIVANALALGLELHLLAYNATSPSGIKGTLLFFNIYFIVELALRMVTLRKAFWCGAETRGWNMFELALVVLSLIEMVFTATSHVKDGSVASTLKALRLMRIIRIFRVFRFFRPLLEISAMLLDSIKSLLLALILLTLVLYVFAMITSSQVMDFLKSHTDVSQPKFWMLLENHDDELVRRLHRSFGSPLRAVYTLCISILGGVSWHECSDPLLEKNLLLAAFFYMSFLTFAMIALLNVVTGIFVDNAFNFAQGQRNIAILKEMEREEVYAQKIKDFFAAVDEDASGEISVDEFEKCLEDPTLAAYFRVLKIEISDAKRFISLVDIDDSGTLSVDEFLEGCTKFKGAAQSIDVHTCLRDLRKIITQQMELERRINERSLLFH
eukprot:TRINITY_DN49628_c0_g1_i1.p1 TRINITY_DN49628_c0_g1~~TRINITY_DN49628_c0_g1_i1.p1  ORF type:complete len:545 (+),score=90.56 TRINITY_DN49628_c0_g1_i1:96-1730(+)